MDDRDEEEDESDDELSPWCVTRTLFLGGEEITLSLEAIFWDGLMWIADEQHKSVGALIEEIDDNTDGEGLSSAIRLFVLQYYRRLAGR